MGGTASAVSEVSSGSGLGNQDRRDGAFVGSEPVGTIVMMEDHDGAYRAWRQAGIRGRILVHIDAHFDWNWIAERDPQEILRARSLAQVEALLEERPLWNLSGREPHELIHIGNYIYPALQEGIVKEFYWVVPDAATQRPTPRGNIRRMLQRLMRRNPRVFTNLREEGRHIRAEIAGKPLTTCSLSDLPPIPEAVLLDIDTDFLTTDFVTGRRRRPDPWKQIPWMWPDELVERLREKGIRTDFVTIAYSVEGGYAPLGYKHLGDEVALRLKHPVLPDGLAEVLAQKRRGAWHRWRDEFDQAIAAYERAVDLAPEDASSHFHLAYLYDERSSHDRAAASYREAVRLDPTYATAYNNFGWVYQSLGLREKAEEEYRRILRWDLHHAEARCGLAEVLAQEGKWDEALRQYQSALEIRPSHPRAYLGLGYIYAKKGMCAEGIKQLDQAIGLRPDDGTAHFWLGDAHARERRWDEAIAAYREALRCGMRTGTTHLRLGSLYLRTRRIYKAWKHYRRGFWLWGCYALISLRGALRGLFEALSTRESPCSR